MPANAGANRYELKELLGEGGMGVVYKALDTRTNSYVALKTLRDAADPAMLEMFKREWAVLGEVPHPNIVDVRDVDEIEENGVRKPCFIMPLLPGSTLASLIKSSSPRLTTEFVVNMVSQVCKGLQAAHEKDLIHRDMKPSNIFIMDDDTAKIIDFGLVHAVGNHSTTGLKGTWQYMAPEQIDGSKQPNRSFDIYSLGVVAYEALTLHQPFKRSKFEDTVDAIRLFVPQAISERNSKVPLMVSKAIHIAMAKLPSSRYATAREFAETIQKAFRNEYIERFDPAKIRPRIDRAKKAFSLGDSEFASEILTELEAEGNLDTDITLLRSQIDEFNKQKRVRQLYEAAQTRLEQDEIPLALDKLQEILKIDPQNSEAFKLRKKIEQQRSDQQVAEWLALARKHLDRHDFSEARRALKEVFNLKYDDPEAAQLKAQVDSREKEVDTARTEKEHLYSNALRHNQNGEISSALSKLERLLELSRNTPGASVPERDKVFQAFYNDIRTERDRIDSAYAEGSRHLLEKDFEKALGTCDGILFRYPQNPQFQALRLKIEHSQRQELSAYIAEVGRAVETEPNLDRRVGLLDEACKRYPNEGQFSRQLSLAKELRDLVASIATRARNYEEGGQFAEAITQWNTLANIHPQYPGIDFEINQLERRREQQSEDDKKSRLVEKIDRALGNAAYAEAQRLSESGLHEFPDNPELLALMRLSQQGLEQTREANRLFEEAKVQRTAGDWDQAVVLLRQALDLDKTNIVIQNTLVKLLTERAHAMLDTDPDAAEPLATEAGRLDPEHPSVNKVIDLIAQAKRKRYVEQTVLQARELQTAHRNQAIDILKQGLSVYPNDGRLQQTLVNLQKEQPATLITHGGGGASAFGIAAPPDAKTELYPGNGVGVQDAPVVPPVKPPQPAVKQPAAKSPIQPPAPPPVSPPSLKSPEPPSGPSSSQKIREAGSLLSQNLKARLGSGSNTTIIGVLIGLLASALVIGLASWYLNRPKTDTVITTPPTRPVLRTVKLSVLPADAVVAIDGTPVSASSSTLSLEDASVHHVSVSRLGYKTVDNPSMKVNGPAWSFALEPEPLQLSVSVPDSSGAVWIDDQQVAQFEDGTWNNKLPLKARSENHVLAVKGKKGDQLFKIGYSIVAGKLAMVEPVNTKDLVVVSSLGKEATIYSGNRAAKLIAPNQEQKLIPQDGLPVTVEDSAAAFSIAAGSTVYPLPVTAGPAPTLTISFINTAPVLVQASVSVTPANAKLFVDGDPMTHGRNGSWTWKAEPRSYQGKLTADGMEDLSFSISLKKGRAFNQHFDMRPKVTFVGPTAAILVMRGGEPGATVSVGGVAIGRLDDKGNGRFPYKAGVYTVELSKDGYGSNSFYKVDFVSGKEVEPRGDKRLKPAVGYARIVSLKPTDAAVTYSHGGETHRVTDLSKITLSPGTYEFAADAPKYLRKSFEVKIEANQLKDLTFDLQPISGPEIPFVSPDDAKKVNGDWYHGVSNGYLPLNLHFKTNTLVFSKDFRVKKMSWRIYLDRNNAITCTLDSKGISIDRRIDGLDAPDKVRDIDMTSQTTGSAYAVQIKIEKNAVMISQPNGTVVAPTEDPKHDWSHAVIYVKGDNFFTVWPGR